MLQQKRSKNYITRSGICCKNAHPTKLHAHPFPLQLTDAPPMRQGCAFVSESPALFKRESGEPADNHDDWRSVCPGLSIGIADGQIREKPLGKPGGFILDNNPIEI